MLQAFLGLIIQGEAFSKFRAFTDHLASLCYKAYGNPNPYERRMALQKIDTLVRGAFSNVPSFQHDQLASNIMSTMASHPFSAAQLRLFGRRECSRQFPVFAPVIYTLADILNQNWNASPAFQVSPQVLPRDAAQRLPGLPNIPRAAPVIDAPPLPQVAQGRNIDGLKSPLRSPPDSLQEALRALQLPPSLDGKADTSNSPGMDEESLTVDEDALEAPNGLERETRLISRLKDKNRKAYDCAVVKLVQARRKDSEGDQAREWITKFVRLPLWEADSPNRIPSVAQQRDMLQAARDVLEAAVAGHTEAKGVLLSHYGRWLRKPDGPGMVMGVQGPPGNGKTTLVERGLSSALRQPAETIDMGGVGDAQILRGDRSLWVGSSPGRIADCLMRTGTRRFILILEEVDKVSKADVQFVISNLTDPNRNSNFEDSYFSGVPLDLSKATIICTFNETRNLDVALASRMGQIVQTSALSDDDKTNIAKSFLIVKALEDANRIGEIVFNDRAVRYIVHLCRRDPGARRLKSYIERVVGTINIAMIQSEQDHYQVTEADVRRLYPKAG